MVTTSLCSVVFIGFTANTSSAATKKTNETLLFNTIVDNALQPIELSDRFVLHAKSGIAISLIGKVEDGLLVALAIRDAIVAHNKTTQNPLQVGIAVNLCAVQVLEEVSQQFKMIGDAIKGAQLIMTFADAGQVLASRSYYEAISIHAQKHVSKFSYFFDIKQDKQHKNYEIYQLGRGNKKASAQLKLSKLERLEKLNGLQTFDDLETFKGLQTFETLEKQVDATMVLATKKKPVKRTSQVKVSPKPSAPAKEVIRLSTTAEAPTINKKSYVYSVLTAIGVVLALLLLSPVKKFLEARHKLELPRNIKPDRQAKPSDEAPAGGYANEPLPKSVKLNSSKVLSKKI